MKIGILSDTHGNLSATHVAVNIFRDTGVDVVFLCGDIGAVEILAELAGDLPVHVVLGNVDVYSADWKFFPSNLGVELHGRFADVSVGGHRIALLHGDDSRRLKNAISVGEYDLVLSGHTHEVHDFMVGKTRCLNPGSAGRGNPKSCAVFDLDSRAFQVFEL